MYLENHSISQYCLCYFNAIMYIYTYLDNVDTYLDKDCWVGEARARVSYRTSYLKIILASEL